MNQPQFAVSFIRHRTCTGCNTVHKEPQTWTYFTSEAALDQAMYLLQHRDEYTLISVDQ